MDWVPLESSVLTRVAYFPVESLLYLEVRNGGIYRYFKVPLQQYEELLASDSKGRYFGRNIRDHFPCEQIHPTLAWRG